MNAIQTIKEFVGIDLSTDIIHYAFYVCSSSQGREICQNGILPCGDGHVHLFGKLACAYTKREILERSGVAHSIFKVDVTGLAPEFDPSGEEVSDMTPVDHDSMCHGFMLTVMVSPGRIISEHSYL